MIFLAKGRPPLVCAYGTAISVHAHYLSMTKHQRPSHSYFVHFESRTQVNSQGGRLVNTDIYPIECKAVKTLHIQRHYMLQGTRNITKMAFAKYECQKREPKQFQAQQLAIVQKFLGGGNNSLIAIEEEKDTGSTTPICASPVDTEPVLVSPSNEVSESQLFNEDPMHELLINEVQFY